MCKHVSAVLYGIGARLDHQPQLLFKLRNVDQQDLIANAGSDLPKKGKRPVSAKVLAHENLSEMFGIDIAPAVTMTTSKRAAAGIGPIEQSTAITAAASSKQTELTRPAKSTKPAPDGKRQRLTSKKRQESSERMRKYWAERRALTQKRKAAEP